MWRLHTRDDKVSTDVYSLPTEYHLKIIKEYKHKMAITMRMEGRGDTDVFDRKMSKRL